MADDPLAVPYTPERAREDLEAALAGRYNAAERAKIDAARALAEEIHADQLRDEDTPYIVHPLSVTLALLRDMPDAPADEVCVALLHDTLEDSETLDPDDLVTQFGAGVARGVVLLSKKTRQAPEKLENPAYFGRLRGADTSLRRLKVLDRLDNLSRLPLSPIPGKIPKYVAETREWYPELAASVSPALAERIEAACRAVEQRGGQQIA